MQLVTYNIQYGKGKDNQYDIDRICTEIDGADVIALQEVERFWPRSGNVDQVAEIAKHFPQHHYVYGAGVDINADVIDADGNLEHQRRQFGNMLLSRYPILSHRNILLPKYASTSPISIQRSAVEGVIDTGETLLRVYSIHLTHLSPETRFPQIDKLIETHDDAQLEGAPITGDVAAMDWNDGVVNQDTPVNAVLMGDFNFVPHSEEYSLMVGPMSEYGGRISNPVRFVDAWTVCGNEEDAGETAQIMERPAKLDYCFVSTRLSGKIKSCRIDNEAQGSDHQPVWTILDV